MKKILSILWTVILLALLILFFMYREEVVNFVMGNVSNYIKVDAPKANEYKKDYSFKLVKNTDNFHVKSKQDILNVLYTVLNDGLNEFTFYCDSKYKKCSNDLADVSQDQTLLSVINNMVNPYNSYEKLYITTSSYGKATIKIEKLYSEDDINKINSKIEIIKANEIKDTMTNEEKIKAYHDYLINNTSYDEERAANIEKGITSGSTYNSHKANGPLLEGKALCSGYSDAMKIFLDELNIPNYKIANKNHIWNLVYINNQWLHLDLTWDDPVTTDGSNLLLHKFFLVDSEKLLTLDKTNHLFEKSYYPEVG